MNNHTMRNNNESTTVLQEDECEVSEANNIHRRGKGAGVEEDGPACESCRKKKAKCSRQQPCSHCVRFNCVYDDRKIKPGLRTGAVENLSQRVVALEHMFLGQGILWQQVWNCLNAIQAQTPKSAYSFPGAPSNDGDSLKECTNRLKSTLSSLSVDFDVSEPLSTSPLKRRCTDSTGEGNQFQKQHRLPILPEDEENDLPPSDLVDALVEIYFANIHSWIPVLHVRQFREKMAIPNQRKKLTTIFHAIVSLCVRFSTDPRLSSAEVRNRYSKRSRQIVILQSMESFSVESLQALVICAFDTIGSGRGPSAWSIVGSMTRTVEQLQLSVEDEDQPRATEFLIKRMAFLPPCSSWIEREERRRVFWNVFLMDRFCSIATGWNFSLTSADVKRRLPCEGALWEEGNPLKTPAPYFGVADKSAGGALPATRGEMEDQVSIGGFAYCIEASESLSLVTTFFLRHAVNFSNPQKVQMWLVRFQELDLRLVQWKVFLPEQWREACALNADGILDPNLTLAHITHNTAVGLLHQGIAYPSPEWQACPTRLPSISSAETCMVAATEVSIIAEKYLEDSTSLTNPQFAFCLFINGRILLAHALHYNMSLSPGFDSLINSLREISRRWNGPHALEGSGVVDNLASKFAARLVQARQQGPHSLDIRQAAYSEDLDRDEVGTSLMPSNLLQSEAHQNSPSQQNHPNFNSVSEGNMMSHVVRSNGQPINSGNAMITDQNGSPDSVSLAFPPLPLALQPHYTCATQAMTNSSGEANWQQTKSFYGRPGDKEYRSMGSYSESSNMGYDGSVNEFEDLNSFFGYSFVPTQRISMFHGVGGKEGE